MKNKDESRAKIEEKTPQSKLGADETELSLEQDINLFFIYLVQLP